MRPLTDNRTVDVFTNEGIRTFTNKCLILSLEITYLCFPRKRCRMFILPCEILGDKHKTHKIYKGDTFDINSVVG